jgi:hypothetical protein
MRLSWGGEFSGLVGFELHSKRAKQWFVDHVDEANHIVKVSPAAGEVIVVAMMDAGMEVV